MNYAHVSPRYAMLKNISFSIGEWSGFLSENDRYPSQCMLSMTFHVSADDPSTFEARSTLADGTPFTMIGRYDPDPESTGAGARYTFRMHHEPGPESDHHALNDKFFSGQIRDTAFVGRWDSQDEVDEPTSVTPRNTFVFKRGPPELMCYYPQPASLAANSSEGERIAKRSRAASLWQFALNAVLTQLHQRKLSWTVLKRRRDARLEFFRLAARWHESYETSKESVQMLSALAPSDARAYHWMWVNLQTTERVHP